MKLNDIIEQSARAAINFQSGNGAMLPGHNGPWNDLETPVRNTGHWLITFIKAYEITRAYVFFDAANRAADYLISTDARPMGAAFLHRKNPLKHASNGLIGQAWTIEALTVGATQLRRPELSKLAEELFFQHPFNYTTGLWSILNVDGTFLNQRRTLNHQIWFAASGSLLMEQAIASEEMKKQVTIFMDHLHEYIRFNIHGIILHRFELPLSSFSRWYQSYKKIFLAKYQKKSDNILEIGYHSFNLYGLALLKEIHPSHPIWASNKLLPMWKPIDSKQYNKLAQNNPYCYLYNPSGIEIAFALHVFRTNVTTLIEQYLTEQFSKTFNVNSGLMDAGGSSDPVTLAARLYEATRFPDYTIHL